MTPDFADKLVALLPNLRRFAMSLARRPDVAEDLVQITVERAISGFAGFDLTTRLEPWLFRIMRNAWIDMTRRARTRGIAVDVHETPEALPHDPAAGIEARLMLGAVRRVMAELPAEQAEVLELVCIAGLSYADAAEVLEIPRGTVMSRLSRARLALSQKLGIE
ncbi:MAG: RNA polymerase sigma factor [Paracoccus sp. (in: a-proteobacteria)]|nr:RNA polymerase sigma factor [Paracoccus sp. (in: a-proteobacteria)]